LSMHIRDARSRRGQFLVDAHVHYHKCFEPKAFLDSALANFRRAAQELGLGSEASRFLLFTDLAEEDSFERLRNEFLADKTASWTFNETGDGLAIVARKGKEEAIVLVAGRQITTREGLEVLALGCRQRFPERKGLEETVDAALGAAAIPVIPWGFGKWWFSRGALVRSILDAAKPHQLYLGDNGGRLRYSPRPGLFKLGESRGIFVLPGSDPLPFPSQAGKAASYGSVIEGELDMQNPAGSLKRAVRELQAPPHSYGRQEGLLGFLQYQLAMQFKKRASRV
jgi:hypothetical protein